MSDNVVNFIKMWTQYANAQPKMPGLPTYGSGTLHKHIVENGVETPAAVTPIKEDYSVDIYLFRYVLRRKTKMNLGGSMRKKKRSHHRCVGKVVVQINQFKNCYPVDTGEMKEMPGSDLVSLDIKFEQRIPV